MNAARDGTGQSLLVRSLLPDGRLGGGSLAQRGVHSLER
jgi:hypothetical protein